MTYDICDPKRLREVYHTMREFGVHVQYSVFRCDLTAMAHAQLVGQLTPIIDPTEDQILFVDIGSSDSRQSKNIKALGRPYVEEEEGAIVV